VSRRRSALRRLVVVVVLVGVGLAGVVFGVIVAGAELARAALGVSMRPELAGPVVVGLAGGECLITAFVVALRAHTPGEDL